MVSGMFLSDSEHKINTMKDCTPNRNYIGKEGVALVCVIITINLSTVRINSIHNVPIYCSIYKNMCYIN